MESFFSTFKREEYNGKHYEFFDELEESIKKYMHYYNDYRPHESLKNKTPNQFEIDYYNKKATNWSWLFLDSPNENLTIFLDRSYGVA